MKKGIDVIEFIQRNHLEDAVVTVTATVYHDGDHDCNTTDNVSIMQSSHYDHEKKQYLPSIDFYVDDNL